MLVELLVELLDDVLLEVVLLLVDEDEVLDQHRMRSSITNGGTELLDEVQEVEDEELVLVEVE